MIPSRVDHRHRCRAVAQLEVLIHGVGAYREIRVMPWIRYADVAIPPPPSRSYALTVTPVVLTLSPLAIDSPASSYNCTTGGVVSELLEVSMIKLPATQFGGVALSQD